MWAEILALPEAVSRRWCKNGSVTRVERRPRRQALVARALDLSQQVMTDDDPADRDVWSSLHLTMPQLKIMVGLSRRGPQRMGALARSLGVSAPTASGVLERMVQRGYVRREGSAEDRRVTIITLTERGTTIMRRLFAAQQNAFARTFQHLSVSEIAVVVSALELLAKAGRRRRGEVASLASKHPRAGT